MRILRRTLAWLLIVDLAVVGAATPAGAAIIGAGDALHNEAVSAAITPLDRVAVEASVTRRLIAWGVNPATAERRIRDLTNEEIQQLARSIDALPPAAAGLLEVVGITFVVLLILELVGVVDIFNRF